MKRIIDKQTGLFIRDDFYFDEGTEISLEVEPPNDKGYIHAKWNGSEWVEGATEIPPQQPQLPTLEERLQALEQLELERMFGL